jgi:hypothetical protein
MADISSNSLDMIQLFAVLNMAHLQLNTFFQQDGDPPHWSLVVEEFLHEIFTR